MGLGSNTVYLETGRAQLKVGTVHQWDTKNSKNHREPSQFIICLISLCLTVPKNFGVSEKCFDIELENNLETLDIGFFKKVRMFGIIIIVAKYGEY